MILNYIVKHIKIKVVIKIIFFCIVNIIIYNLISIIRCENSLKIIIVLFF